jgi:Transcriptional regulators
MNTGSNNSNAHNAVDRAYEFLYNQTVNFELPPGRRINEVELAATLGMSRAPVREALNRLVAKNLVVFEAGKGFFCRKLSTTEVGELFEVRSDLEIAAIRSACRIASDESLRNIVAKWQDYGADQKTAENDLVVSTDEAFHLELAALAQNDERVNFLASINERIRFVRRIHIETMDVRQVFIEDHNRILAALSQRDVELTVAVMEKHFSVNSSSLKENIRAGLAKIYADEVL